MPTEKEAVLRERAACAKGFRIARGGGSALSWTPEETAANEYPLPTVPRPRVLRDPHLCEFKWTTHDGTLVVVHFTYPNGEVYPRTGEGLHVTAERATLWARLLANPTEEVEE